MRGRWTLAVGLALRAGCAAAGDLAPIDKAPSAPVQVAAWPGFAIARTAELAAVPWPVADAQAGAVNSTAASVSNPEAACGATPIAARALAASTAHARDGLIASVRAAECRHRLPAGLLDAVVLAESAYRPRALSRAGAVGLTQLMRGTAMEVGVPDRRDTAQSIEGGAKYLRRMIDRFGEVRLALAAYNAGPGAVARAGGVPDNGETPGYIARVVGLWRAVAVDGALPVLEPRRSLPAANSPIYP